MILASKIIAIFLAVIAVSKSYLDYRKRLEPLAMFIFWLVLWSIATLLITYPILIERISIYTKDNTLTIGSITSVAFVFMLYIVYRVYAKAARIEYQLTQVIRELSLNKVNKIELTTNVEQPLYDLVDKASELMKKNE